MQIEIDSGSGFCFGVTTAIKKAEEELACGKTLYCLGDIVHNGMECERLRRMGLITINHDDLESLHGVKVLLRAHGEPPQTYELARRNNIEIIDATCPVVLQLQRRIKRQYDSNPEAQIVIFGKNGHAEVLGLVGQTESRAIVIETFADVVKLDFGTEVNGRAGRSVSCRVHHRLRVHRRVRPAVRPASRSHARGDLQSGALCGNRRASGRIGRRNRGNHHVLRSRDLRPNLPGFPRFPRVM